MRACFFDRGRWMLGVLFALGAAVSGAQEGPSLVVNIGHTSFITAVALSADGKNALTASADRTLRLWDVATRRELRRFDGHREMVTALSFSPDGGTALSAGNDRTLRLWDVATGRELRRLESESECCDKAEYVAFSSDGRHALLDGWDKSIRLWDIASGRELARIKLQERATAIAFNPDGNTVLWSSKDGVLHLWDLKTGHELRSMERHRDYIRTIAFSPNGKLALSGGGNSIRLWDVAAGQELRRIAELDKPVSHVAFLPDGKHALSASSDHEIRLWDLATSKELRQMEGHGVGKLKSDVRFSTDGKSVLTAHIGRNPHLGDVATGRELGAFNTPGQYVQSLAFSPDGKQIISASWDKDLRLWDLAASGAERRLAGHKGVVLSVDVSPDGKTALSGGGDKTIRLWDLSTGDELRRMAGHTESINSVAFSPDGKTVLSGGSDKTIRLWDLSTGDELRRMAGHTASIDAVAFSPDGKTALSGGSDKTVRHWDLSTGHELRRMEGHSESIRSIAFSPDGKTALLGGFHGLPLLMEVTSGRVLKRLESPRGDALSVGFSPDGIAAVSGGWEDSTIRLWDLVAGTEMRHWVGHSHGITKATFSPDGRYIASSSYDGTIKLWRSPDGKELATLMSFSDGTWVVTDPEGRFDTADLESMPYLHWILPDAPFTPLPLEVFMKDYYEPRLLMRILAGETFMPVRPLISLNRTQPEVTILPVVLDTLDPSLVYVTVQASGAKKGYPQHGKYFARSTAVHDLRLFRDGQLVGYTDGKLSEFNGRSFSRTFTVRLPYSKVGKPVVLSAYAFNDDNVKSETVRTSFTVPDYPIANKTVSSTKGIAYIISMGVNQHDNPDWNLSFAANDARELAQRLAGDLQRTGQYQSVVAVALLADGGLRQASKAALRAVISLLAGKVNPQTDVALQGVTGVNNLQAAKPDDLILLSFAGHGFADDSSNFFLIPQDTGRGTGKAITSELRQRSISSEELSLWMRDVDAGNITMIVDACQSAATVQGNGFKPGPMGSRGMGQLAYDKGMRILAASQSDEYALEDQRLRHGLLSYSLLIDGLEAFGADHEPKDKTIFLDEWLRYSVKRVPALADEVKSGRVTVVVHRENRNAKIIDLTPVSNTSGRPAQQPALFNFAKKREAVLVLRE